MENKESNFVSAIIYVYNAEKTIDSFLSVIVDILENNFDLSEIICVDDSSSDSSYKRIKEVSSIAKRTNISLVRLSHYHGIEYAMNAGIDLAIGDYIFEFDNTILDFNSSFIMDIYRKSLQGFDIVSAIPNKKERISSKIFYKVFSDLSNASSEMNTESFRIVSRRIINRVRSMNIAIPYRKAIYYNCGMNTASMNYEMQNPVNMVIDKKEKKFRFELAVDSLILFTGIGYKFSVSMAVLMMCISIFMILSSVIIFLTMHPIEGWTTTILFLSIAFFGLFGILSIIIKYLQLLIDLVFRKKHYCYESIEKLSNK